jgi:hypothetical protein
MENSKKPIWIVNRKEKTLTYLFQGRARVYECATDQIFDRQLEQLRNMGAVIREIDTYTLIENNSGGQK